MANFDPRTTLLLSAALAMGSAAAQVPPCTGYVADFTIGSHGREWINDAIKTSDGNVLLVGYTNDDGHYGNITDTRLGLSDGLVVKMDVAGNVLWSKVLGGSGHDNLYHIIELNDGSLLIGGITSSIDGALTGTSLIGYLVDGWYARLTPIGDLIWSKRVGVPGQRMDIGGLAATADGAIVLTPIGHPLDGLRIDMDGNTIVSSPAFQGSDIRPAGDGGYVVLRRDFPFGFPSTGQNTWLTHIDADGIASWVHQYVAYGEEHPIAVRALSDGYVIMVNVEFITIGFDITDPGYGAGQRDTWVIRTDLTGTILWQRVFGGSGDDVLRDAVEDMDGGILLFGSTTSSASGDITEISNGGEDFWTVKVDASGVKLWDKIYGGSSREGGNRLIPVPLGHLQIGWSYSPLDGDRHSAPFDGADGWVVPLYTGVPTTWYADADADGLGDANTLQTSCVQPSGYVDNSSDCNDLITDPTGHFIGAPCNDLDPTTTYDRYQDDCTCAGFIPLPADITAITFTLWPDFDPGETTWELRDMATQQIAMQGGPYPNGQQGVPESASVLIPPVCNQRFQLFVYDGQSNGMQGGRYTLTANGKRLIDSDGLFQQVSTVSSSLIPIDVPMGNIGLTQYTCDRLDLLPTSVIVASEDIEVSVRYDLKESDTGYQFWIFDPHGSYSRRIFKSHKNPGKGGAPGPTECAHLKLSSIVTSPVPQNKLLNVRVRTRIQGVDGAFGPACTMKVDPNAATCPTTKLIDSPNDPHYSCNQSYPLDGSTRIWAHAKAGVNKYQFEFRDQQGPYVRTIASATASLLMTTWYTNPLQPLHVYNVRVRCSKDGGQTWCPWGDACEVYTSSDGRSMQAVAQDARDAFSVFPNPVEGGVVRVHFSGSAASDDPVQISLIDMAGALVMRKQLNAAELLDAPLLLPPSLASGSYVLSLSCNGARFQELLIVQ